jgi:hypothetical protein
MANTSIFKAFERMWQHIVALSGTKMNNDNPVCHGSFSMNRAGDVGDASATFGSGCEASGAASFAEGIDTIASGEASHTEGDCATASGYAAHAEGNSTIASGEHSHAEGLNTMAIGDNSHAEGKGTNLIPASISGESTNDEIISTWENTPFLLAKAVNSHAEGQDSVALGEASHVEGNKNITVGYFSHAEGHDTQAHGNFSHTEGASTKTSGLANSAHAEGTGTVASGRSQHVQGEYNIIDTQVDEIGGADRKRYAHIVGNGSSDTSRSNAHTLDWSGNAWFAGDVYVGGTDQDTESKKLVAAPTALASGMMLIYNGTSWVTITKEDLITEIIAALPNAEEASF